MKLVETTPSDFYKDRTVLKGEDLDRKGTRAEMLDDGSVVLKFPGQGDARLSPWEVRKLRDVLAASPQSGSKKKKRSEPGSGDDTGGW